MKQTNQKWFILLNVVAIFYAILAILLSFFIAWDLGWKGLENCMMHPDRLMFCHLKFFFLSIPLIIVCFLSKNLWVLTKFLILCCFLSFLSLYIHSSFSMILTLIAISGFGICIIVALLEYLTPSFNNKSSSK